MFWLLIYDLVDDYLERRTALRADHLALAQAAHGRGELLLAGALADPADQAFLVFHVDDPSQIEKFVEQDPYVQNGLVEDWQIRRWTVVIGTESPAQRLGEEA
ncbi:MAG TPA: YciI-like protein [Acidimicrobiales bacterium]|jgi:uncharacterized protein YciI|nr:YciI-like protein [Acidimicrobiales bacterium]